MKKSTAAHRPLRCHRLPLVACLLSCYFFSPVRNSSRCWILTDYGLCLWMASRKRKQHGSSEPNLQVQCERYARTAVPCFFLASKKRLADSFYCFLFCFFSLCFLFSAGEQALQTVSVSLSCPLDTVGCSAIEVWQISFYFPAVLVVFKETFAVWVRFPRETGLVQFIWCYSAITLKEAAEGGLCKARRSWTGRACPGATETRKLGSI